MSAVPMTRVMRRVPTLLGGSGLARAVHPPRRALPALFLPWMEDHRNAALAPALAEVRL